MNKAHPTIDACPGCGEVRVRRSIGIGEATVQWAYVNAHRDDVVKLTVTLDGAAVLVEVRLSEDGFRRDITDPESVTDAEDRIFELVDEVVETDRWLVSYFDRVRSGDTTIPQAQSYRLPDAVFDLPEDGRALRAFQSKSFVVLRDKPLSFAEIGMLMGGGSKQAGLVERFVETADAAQFFVRCLLPIPVQGASSWNIGVWVEVEQTVFFEVRAAWESDAYKNLRFSGTIANELDAVFEGALGAHVEVTAVDDRSTPFVSWSERPSVQSQLDTPWAVETFTRFAVDGAFL